MSNERTKIKASKILILEKSDSNNCNNAQRKSRKELSRKVTLQYFRRATPNLINIPKKFSSRALVSNQMIDEQPSSSQTPSDELTGTKKNTQRRNLTRKINQLPIQPEGNPPAPVTQKLKINSDLLSNKTQDPIQIKLNEHSKNDKEKEDPTNQASSQEAPKKVRVRRTKKSKINII